jgi:hypothetical protein
LPTWSDKLLAEVVRMVLNAYYDVQFSEHSHGFRPGRGCHTALQEIVDVWNGTHWGLSRATSPGVSSRSIITSCSRRWARRSTITGFSD